MLGLIMVLSASSVASITNDGSPWSLFERQVMWSVLGGGVFFVASRGRRDAGGGSPCRWSSCRSSCSLSCLVHGVGTVAGGSSRWIGLGPLSLQPSEFTKLAFALFAADLVARRSRCVDDVLTDDRPPARARARRSRRA